MEQALNNPAQPSATAQQLELDQLQDQVNHMEFAFTEANTSLLALAEKIALAINQKNSDDQELARDNSGGFAKVCEKIEAIAVRLDALEDRLHAPLSTVQAEIKAVLVAGAKKEKTFEKFDQQLADIFRVLDQGSGPAQPRNVASVGLHDEDEQKNSLEKKLDVLMALVQRLASSVEKNSQIVHDHVIGLPDIDCFWQEISSRLEKLLDERVVALENAISVFCGTNAEASREKETFESHFEALAGKIDVLLTRPNPTVDLAPQRRSLAKFLSAIGSTTERIEEVAEFVASRGTVESDDPISTGAIVKALASVINQKFNELSDKISSDISGSYNSLESGYPRLESLEEKIDALRSRPNPTIDFTSQAKSLAKFSRVAEHLVDRIEKIPHRDTSDSTMELSEKFENIYSRMEGLLDTEEYRKGPHVHGTGDPDVMREMLEKLHEVTSNRVDPMAITESFRKSLSRFHAVNEAVLRRFANLVSVSEEYFASLENSSQLEGGMNSDSKGSVSSQLELVQSISDLAQANRILVSNIKRIHKWEDEESGRGSAEFRTVLAESIALSIKSDVKI